MRVTKELLQSRVDRINDHFKIPKDICILDAVGAYVLDINSNGYQLEQVTQKGGSVKVILERSSKSSMFVQLGAFLQGLTCEK